MVSLILVSIEKIFLFSKTKHVSFFYFGRIRFSLISINKNISTSTQLLNLKKVLKKTKIQKQPRTNSSSSTTTSTKSSNATSKYKKQFKDFEPIINYVKETNNLKSNRIAVRFTNIAYREYKKVKNDATPASFNDFILENHCDFPSTELSSILGAIEKAGRPCD